MKDLALSILRFSASDFVSVAMCYGSDDGPQRGHVFCFFSGAVSRICTYTHQRTRRTIWLDAILCLEIQGCSEDPDSFQRLLCWWFAFDCENLNRKCFHFKVHHCVVLPTLNE